MVVYHGSDSNFKKLRISDKLVKRVSTKDNEGTGIYFSIDKEVARSYGKYIYTLEVSDNCFLDFRKKSVCRDYVHSLVKGVYDRFGVNIYLYADLNSMIDRVYWGGQAIYRIGNNLSEMLDNTDRFYCSFPTTKRESIYRLLKSYDRGIKAYMFNYHIKDIGVLKNVGEDVVRILSKESSY